MYKINFQDDFYGNIVPTAALNIYNQHALFVPLFAQQGGHHHQGPKHWTEREHDCGMYYLLYTIDGSGLLKYENNSYELFKGDIIFVDANTYHYYKTGRLGHWKYCYINLYGNGCKIYYDFLFHDGFKILNEPNIEKTVKMFDEIYDLIDKHSFEDNVKISEILSSFFHNVASKAYKSNASPSLEWNLDYSIRYIESNFTSDIKISKLANSFNVSTEYFIRQFKKNTGLSPYKYMLDLRINLAKNMLKFMNRPIFEIATLSGFKTAANMIYCFNKYEGISPLEFRQRYTEAIKK